jgi:hypothetical protein
LGGRGNELSLRGSRQVQGRSLSFRRGSESTSKTPNSWGRFSDAPPEGTDPPEKPAPAGEDPPTGIGATGGGAAGAGASGVMSGSPTGLGARSPPPSKPPTVRASWLTTSKARAAISVARSGKESTSVPTARASSLAERSAASSGELDWGVAIALAGTELSEDCPSDGSWLNLEPSATRAGSTSASGTGSGTGCGAGSGAGCGVGSGAGCSVGSGAGCGVGSGAGSDVVSLGAGSGADLGVGSDAGWESDSGAGRDSASEALGSALLPAGWALSPAGASADSCASASRPTTIRAPAVISSEPTNANTNHRIDRWLLAPAAASNTLLRLGTIVRSSWLVSCSCDQSVCPTLARSPVGQLGSRSHQWLPPPRCPESGAEFAAST